MANSQVDVFFVSALALVRSTIDVKTGRGIGRRILESSDDVGAVVKAFRCVAVLVENFSVRGRDAIL